ncbi:TRAP transporter small permease [Oscillospiraceae bacterium LTW-04]|nr:TRAP transporter small permease [Oscillospiraceae bacterium MB24-C1]
MNNTISVVRKALDKVVDIKRYICAVLLIIMTSITFVQVIMRFVFRAPFSWAEEVTLMFLVWFGYICMSIDIYTDTHSALYFLYNKLPPLPKKLADLLRHGALFWLFYEMLKYGWIITKMNLPKPQPATHFSQGWLFAPLVVGGLFMLLYSLVNLLSVLLKPLSEYHTKPDHEKTVEEMNIERGGTV